MLRCHIAAHVKYAAGNTQNFLRGVAEYAPAQLPKPFGKRPDHAAMTMYPEEV